MAEQEDNQEKHPGGRPLKYQTVAELDLAIQLYFDKCDPHIETHLIANGISGKGETMFEERKVLTDQRPYTMSGLARALGISRQTLLDYSERPEFLDSIQAAKDKCQEYAESQLFGPYANGAKFSLTNNYKGKYQDWSDKHEVDHTSGGKPIKALVEFVGDEPTNGQDTGTD